MGRWDDHNASNDKEQRDEWQKEHGTDFDWKETPIKKHAKKCDCPKCEYRVEQRKNPIKQLPIILKLCPDHLKLFTDELPKMIKELNWINRLLIKFMLWRKWIITKELKYAESAICLWCRFGTGGRGIKKFLPPPDMP